MGSSPLLMEGYGLKSSVNRVMGAGLLLTKSHRIKFTVNRGMGSSPLLAESHGFRPTANRVMGSSPLQTGITGSSHFEIFYLLLFILMRILEISYLALIPKS